MITPNNYDTENYWHNYKTQQWESHPSGFAFTLTDQTALDYIPQDPAAIGMFQCLRMLDWSIMDAMIHVLEACTGTEHTKKVSAADVSGGESPNG